MEKYAMRDRTITIKDIVLGIAFCIVIFSLGYFLNLVIKIGLFEAGFYILSTVKSKPILFVILVVVVILGALVSVLSTSIEYGLSTNKFIRGEQEETKDRKDKK